MAEGEKVTEIVQLACPVSDEPQWFVCVKLAGFAPVIVMEYNVSGMSPVLVSVTICGVLVVASV
jgi:hypothetical protein